MGACSPAFLSGLDVVREVCVVAADGGAVASHCPRGAEWQRAGTQRGYGPPAHSWRTAMKVDLTGARPLNPADPASCGPREGPCWAGPRPGMPLPSPGIRERRASGGRWQCSDERPATHEGALGAAPALTAGSPHSETQTPASGLKRGTVFQTVSGEVAGGCLAPLPCLPRGGQERTMVSTSDVNPPSSFSLPDLQRSIHVGGKETFRDESPGQGGRGLPEPVIPTTWEAEAGESRESGRWRLQ
ncbi:uncharacterized protein LOC115896923 [Rhinopithecus roxellana]|uniref:uncharacterized protein LOC115896923 n=1 Tax=Rhinopithecus roxellana TaxID=61622 RepID=UPI0012371B8B|nr:uncharacterized protein LOC115896923 [Rhinopithecus roxellana]